MQRISHISRLLLVVLALTPAALGEPPAPRTLVVGIEFDRHGARVLHYTTKDRPFVRYPRAKGRFPFVHLCHCS